MSRGARTIPTLCFPSTFPSGKLWGVKTLCFVCHGNICRSVAAEYIAKSLLRERGMDKDVRVFSRAVSYEESGNDIYPPMKSALSRAGIPFGPHQARRFSADDYAIADVVYYMEEGNRTRLGYIVIDAAHKYFPITTYESDIDRIEDPWYSGRHDEVVAQLTRCINHILDHLKP